MILSVDLGPILELLNQARKDAGYEGEDPDFGAWTPEQLVSAVEEPVQTAEDAVEAVDQAAQTPQHAQDIEEQSTS